MRSRSTQFIVFICSLIIAWPLAARTEASLFDRPMTDEIFYFLMIDRFADGSPQNNKGLDKIAFDAKDSKQDIVRHGYDPSLESFYHGGDFLGIVQKLDYLQNLGVTSIWLSPILKNRATQVGASPHGVISGYHGYWVMDFTKVDPHWGTEADFKALIDSAHQRGIKVFIDVIVNHTADQISYRECSECPYRSRADFPYAGRRRDKEFNQGFVDGDLSEANFERLKDADFAYTPFVMDPKVRKHPEWLNQFIYYHNRGNSSFSGENSELGDFFGLDDLFTEHPRVVAGMIEIYSNLVKKYKFDGLRLDTVKHVNIEFWQKFIPAIRAAAKQAGLAHFFIFGEVFSSDPAILSHYTRHGKMNAVLDFTFQSAVKDVFAEGQSAEKLHEAFQSDDMHRQGSSPQSMLSFISNHDIGRLGYFMKNKFKDASDAELLQRLTLAHAFMFFARGIPVLYYGDEQGFVGFGEDKGAREDMFPSKTPIYRELQNIGSKRSPAHDNFDSKHPLYLAIQSMATLYKSHEALRSGEYFPLRGLGADIFAFKRSHFEAAEEYITVFNMHPQAVRSISWPRPVYAQIAPLPGPVTQSFSLPPLSYAIFKGPKLKESPRLAVDFKDLNDGQRLSQLFFAELNIPESVAAEVTFKTRTGQEKDFKTLYVDSNPPYRAYIDGTAYPDGTELWLKAEVNLPQQKPQSVSRRLLIDSRAPLVTLVYENGRQRREVSTLSRQGRVGRAQTLGADNSFSLPWPLQEESQLVIFGSPTATGAYQYDRPVLLSTKEHILPHLKAGPEGQPVVTLYLNNRHEISAEKMQAAPAVQVQSLELRGGAAAPFGKRTLYVRGGMNAWQIKDQDALIYKGYNTYRAQIELRSGTIEFKIADRDWSAATNLGSPIGKEGLSASGGSSNLSLELAPGEAGRYNFELVALPALGQDPPLTFLRVGKVE